MIGGSREEFAWIHTRDYFHFYIWIRVERSIIYMTALLFALGIVVLTLVLIVFIVHRMVDMVMKLHDDLLDERLGNYGIDKVSKKYKEENQ